MLKQFAKINGAKKIDRPQCKTVLSLLLSLVLAAVFLLQPTQAVQLASSITQLAITAFGIGFILLSTAVLILSIVIALSPWGKIKLGGADAQCEFGGFSWIAMLFAAGMGSGLVFWGVAEPVFHFANPPAFARETSDAKTMALALTYFHWGFNAWSIYAIAGLAIAWFAFNRERDMTISASFTDKKQFSLYSPVDLLAVVAVVFGVAGTLANSIALIQTGLSESLTIDNDNLFSRIGLLLLLAAAFTASSVFGLKRGIKALSVFNLCFVVLLLMVVTFSLSPLTVMQTFIESSWVYLKNLPEWSTSIDQSSRRWSENWSITYLLWWIAWAPFVGPFIARISKGRTIRQFLLCTVFIPSITSAIWFSAFAGGLFHLPILDEVVQAVSTDYTQGLFSFLAYIDQSQWLSLAAILLLATFVITSADSAIYVILLLTGGHGGYSKLMWSAVLVIITIALLYENNVDLNKQIAIIGAIPFSLVLAAQMVAMLRSMWCESQLAKVSSE